jgi:lantibiotic modifying enzyme
MLARPTMDYISVLSRSLSPEPLRSTEARARRVEEDLRELGALRFDAVRDLSPAEAASLRAGDVPRFEVAASDTHCGDVALLTTPLESARARWAALDAFDRNLQSTCIRERLLDRAGGMAAPLSSASPGALERRALEFAAVLALAAGAPDGGPGWVYASYAPGLGATMAHADRESLYEGAAGTALFLAEAGRVAGERDWGRLASGVFGPVVRGETPVAVRRSGGIGRGLGGLLYAMTRVADATGDEALLEAAVRVALEEGPRLAHADVLDEVLYGRAGLLLSVLALHTRRPSEPLRAVADVVARRLLRRAVSGERGTYWPVSSGPPMPHVSHGAAGIAMALARWARLRGDDAAARVAVRALEFDDTFWLDGEQGWIDARFEEKEGGPEHRTTWSWCNGRSGGLLARLAVAEALETPFPTGCTQHALKADGTDVMADVLPGLCCGTPGAVDALLHLHQRAPGHGAGERAASAIELLARETPRSHYSTLTASLFTGTAGLAFAFLRAARTEEVSSVLWFG